MAAAHCNEFNIHGLYLYHTPLGQNANQSTIIDSGDFGTTVVNNWTVYDGPGSDAKIVARAQGLHIHASNWHNSFSLVFENGRYEGSTLQVMGLVVENGEWAIVGGTGEFSMASGVIQKKFYEQRSNGNIIELTIQGFCPVLVAKPHADKVGTWGGNGGSPQDITWAPKRVESITINSGTVLDSITFSYTDHAGKQHTVGPWGGTGGSPHKIQLAPDEYVKELSGTYGTFNGATVITLFKLVTNIQTFGPWAEVKGTPFSIPV